MVTEYYLPGIKKIRRKKLRLESSFIDFASHFAEEEGTVLLLSGGDKAESPHSILALSPVMIITCKEGLVTLKSDTFEKDIETDPFSFLEYTVSFYEKETDTVVPGTEVFPGPVTAGLFGYLSYDLKNYIENIPRMTVDEPPLPEMFLVLPEVVITGNSGSGQADVYLITYEGREGFPERYYEKAVTDASGRGYSGGFYAAGPLRSDFEKEEYADVILSIIDYIKAGEIYQVNMSQRFTAEFSGSPFSLFHDLFSENPAEFFSYVNCGDHHIVSTSPERFIRRSGELIEARPIKGTRPRGRNEAEDAELRKSLLESSKDDAELSMIVDLLRNDIGKVCRTGSVRVTAHKRLESYKNVHHLVSIVEGIIDDGKGSIDLIKAAFPGGSITGCPKVRAMEIIEELEPARRHIYTGSVGYIGFQNNMDFSIAIRTAVIHGGRIYFSAGGGIVFDSVPEDEYMETLHKAESFRKILNRKQTLLSGTPKVWHNGKTVPAGKAFISADSPGYQYGKGVFETMLCRDGKVEYLKEHLTRLDEACVRIFGTGAPDLSWETIILHLARVNKLDCRSVSVKIIVSEGNGFSRGKYNITVTVKDYVHRLERLGKDGVALGIYPETRNNFLFGFKTANYLFNHLAGVWAEKNGYDEAVILNKDGTVSETNTANILLFSGKTIIKPVSSSALPGIMENAVMEKYLERDYHVEEKPVYPEDLLSEGVKVYITNSLIGMIPVSSISLSGERP